ncbi:hypothetical protein DUNSADRAFT_15565 [Dunaliella salina]|uniref:MRH domain-containing protein n=1 Tax=Dunaliella salina TaxID=3046 RepID=A0ABQ7G566_DUNSA|nr:hypothetical protein DUNSADRAFT_15565 [Dunaliella salina]|eukprot:KAF5829741.1 hypothetical protein DUNSADRAFT_15565 [Dunaliella salina]
MARKCCMFSCSDGNCCMAAHGYGCAVARVPWTGQQRVEGHLRWHSAACVHARCLQAGGHSYSAHAQQYCQSGGQHSIRPRPRFCCDQTRQGTASSSASMQESPGEASSSQSSSGGNTGSGGEGGGGSGSGSIADSRGSDGNADNNSGGGSGKGSDPPPTFAERAAVQQACKKLLQGPAATAVADAIAGEALKFRAQVLTLLQDHGLLEPPEDAEATEERGKGTSDELDGKDARGYLSEEETDQIEEKEAQASALLQRLVIEARPDGLHVRAKRWEEAEGEDYEDDDARCVDLHPMCETWADEGECEANPEYMIGTAIHPGHCLRACAMCSTLPSSDEVGELRREDLGGDDAIDPSFLAQLQAILNLRTMALKNEACVKGSKSCISAHSTTSRGAGLVLGGGGVLGSSPQDILQNLQSTTGRGAGGPGKADAVQVAEQTVKPGGFVLGRPSWGHPLVVGLSQREQQVLRMHSAARAHQQQYKELLKQQTGRGAGKQAGRVSKEAGATGQGGEKGISGGHERANSADKQQQQQQQQQYVQGMGKTVDEVLQKELGDKFILLPTEFFVFEYLYKNHTRHYHEEKGKKGEQALVTEDWMLGTYNGESLPTEVDERGLPTQVLQDLDLLPLTNGHSMRTHQWPYVRQSYVEGHKCFLAGGRQEVRSTEVRIACSPDRRLHMLVREPDFCSYIFVLYSPAVCELPMLQPIPEA